MTLHLARNAAYATALALLPAALVAQAPGIVAGRVYDERSGAPLANAGVQIVGMTLGTMTADDGGFRIPGVRAGTVTIHVRRIGYAPRTITGLMLAEGATIEQAVALVPTAVELETQRITASVRGSVSEALDRQRSAEGVTNAVTAEEMSRSPDGDAAQAIQRVSGVTVQDGKYVSVRGLNERYTVTSLNGARIPSPEPEKKIVPLDLFPAGLLQSVTTAKTFTPDQPGDFAGASVDIQTREFPLAPMRSYSLSAGYNSAATGKSVLTAPGVGGEWAALTGSRRGVPALVREAGSFRRSYTDQEMNGFVRSFRNAWSADRANGRPNLSAGTALGGRDSLFGHGFGYIASLGYSLSTEVRRNEYRAKAAPNGSGGFAPFNAYSGETGRSSAQWGGIMNLSTLLGRTKVDVNNMYTRTSDNDARVDSGTYSPDGIDIRRTVLRYVERSAWSSQLRLERGIGDRQLVKGSITGALVTRDEPDRSELTYGYETDPVTGQRTALRWQQAYSDAARRAYAELRERDFSATADYRVELGSIERPVALKVGAYGRRTHRTSDSRAYSLIGALVDADRELPAEVIFDGRFAEGGAAFLRVNPNATTGAYAATDLIGASYAMIEARPLERVRTSLGARAEQAQMDLATATLGGTAVDTTYRHFDVLPSAVVTVMLGESQNLRFAASQTLSRPEYRERAPVKYYDVIEDDLVEGRTDLRQATIRNGDVRWEWYPSPAELVSIGVFAKRFTDPIERVYINSAGGELLSFVNAKGAASTGLEVEVRQGLGRVAESLDALAVSVNATWMRSRIDIEDGGLSSLSNPSRPMYGQAPYVINGALSWTSEGGRTTATALFNRVGRRITGVGVGGIPDSYEQPRNAVDLSLRFPLVGALAASVDAKNLLDEQFLVTSGPLTRDRYTVGRTVSLGVSWKP